MSAARVAKRRAVFCCLQKKNRLENQCFMKRQGKTPAKLLTNVNKRNIFVQQFTA